MSIYSSETDIFSQKIQISPINIPKSYLLFRTSFNTATFRGTDSNNTYIAPSLSSSVDFTDRRSVTSTDDRGLYVTKGAVKPTDKHLFPINNIPITNNWQFSEITQLSIYTPITSSRIGPNLSHSVALLPNEIKNASRLSEGQLLRNNVTLPLESPLECVRGPLDLNLEHLRCSEGDLNRQMCKTPLRINNKHRSITQKKVNFKPKYDKIIIIQGLSFYNENNMKKDIWWSTTEMNNMRQMVTNEINRMKRLHPRWSVTQCIQELYRLDN